MGITPGIMGIAVSNSTEPVPVPDTSRKRQYPQFNQLLCEENYYLAISILEIPRDARTMQWFGNGCIGEETIE